MNINFKRVLGITLISSPFAVLGALASIILGATITIGVIVSVAMIYGILYLGLSLLYK